MSNNSRAIVRVAVAGRSWEFPSGSEYCFEATVDGELSELHVSEEVAFDLLGAWTRSTEKCLDILRLHRADLARSLERKIQALGRPVGVHTYFLDLSDIERSNPTARDQARASRSGEPQTETEAEDAAEHAPHLTLVPRNR